MPVRRLVGKDVESQKTFAFGGEARKRPYFPAVAVLKCLILLEIQALPALSDHIIFDPFGVRFGVRFTDVNLLCNSHASVRCKALVSSDKQDVH